MRQLRLLLTLVVVSVLASGAGWWAAGKLRSPAQVAADARPPARADLLATVRRQRLTETVVFEGVVDLGARREVTPTASGVVTGVRVGPGSVVSPGDVLLEVNDRPVIALRGSVPLWRDLAYGDTGDDVARFQGALAAAGYPGGDASGNYGAGTSAAVQALYEDAGFEPAVRLSASGEPPTENPNDDGGPTPVQVVPEAEIVMVPALPARVASVGARLGSTETGTVTLTTGDPEVIAAVNPLDAQKLGVGQRVSATSDGPVGSFTGVVVEVAPPAQGEDGFVSRVRITPDRRLRLAASGQSVRLVARSSAPRATLVVPASAISSRADGELVVTVVTAGRREVRVDVLSEANGRVSIAADPDALAPGDRVVIGVR